MSVTPAVHQRLGPPKPGGSVNAVSPVPPTPARIGTASLNSRRPDLFDWRRNCYQNRGVPDHPSRRRGSWSASSPRYRKNNEAAATGAPFPATISTIYVLKLSAFSGYSWCSSSSSRSASAARGCQVAALMPPRIRLAPRSPRVIRGHRRTAARCAVTPERRRLVPLSASYRPHTQVEANGVPSRVEKFVGPSSALARIALLQRLPMPRMPPQQTSLRARVTHHRRALPLLFPGVGGDDVGEERARRFRGCGDATLAASWSTCSAVSIPREQRC